MREIDYLRRIADDCRRNAPLDPELARWLASGLDQFLAHRARDVDEALGLRYGRGGMAWWKEEAVRRRNDTVRAFAERHFPSQSVCAQAKAIRAASSRYGASAWRFDCEREAMPAHYAGTAHEYLWAAFRSGAPMPLSERQLRDILRR